eukprot:1579488-Heterocapsa_arctica.AAC.1
MFTHSKRESEAGHFYETLRRQHMRRTFARYALLSYLGYRIDGTERADHKDLCGPESDSAENSQTGRHIHILDEEVK